MKLSREQLQEIAGTRGYRIEIVEKVVLLSQLLKNIFKLPLLNDSFALKGGTALNLFYFTEIPRLSVDIDLNYIKAVNREKMLQDRKQVEDALVRICNQEGYTIKRYPKCHAGGKMTLQYDSALGYKGKLEVDLNYMYRNPIFNIQRRSSHDWPYKVEGISVLDIHELAAGKLHALFTRTAARDLFDIYQLLSAYKLDKQKLRLAFIVYIAMSKASWQDFNLNNISFNIINIRNELIPVINKDIIAVQSEKTLQTWAISVINEVKTRMGTLLFPLTDNEQEFLREVHENGKICPRLICNNDTVMHRIETHPNLLWRIRTKANNQTTV